MSRIYPSWKRPPNWISIPELIGRYGLMNKATLDASSSVHAVTGRISRIRESSKKLWFVDLVQDGQRSQLLLNQAAYHDKDEFRNLTRMLTRGDIIEAEGCITRTFTGELSLRVNNLHILSPVQMQLPDSQLDIENRVRFRHLDMLSNGDFVKVLKTRSKLLQLIRKYLDEDGFTEVETPILSSKYGGANARPFQTTHMSDHQLFMRIAPELSLKQLVVGDLERVYELGKVFRNEGFDDSHNPEFTSLEFYQAYANCEDMMRHTEDMLCTISTLMGSTLFTSKPFERVDIVPVLEDRLQSPLPLKEPDLIAKEKLLKLAKERDIFSVHEKQAVPKIYDKLIGHFIEPLCQEPTFIVGHPMSLSPLAKAKPGNPFIADRFELFVQCSEIANGFSEQNDPTAQLEAFRKQAQDKASGDLEAQPTDEDFVNVLKAGLPPTGGCGIGIDRLVMLLTRKRHIRDVIAFPLVKPKLN